MIRTPSRKGSSCLLSIKEVYSERDFLEPLPALDIFKITAPIIILAYVNFLAYANFLVLTCFGPKSRCQRRLVTTKQLASMEPHQQSTLQQSSTGDYKHSKFRTNLHRKTLDLQGQGQQACSGTRLAVWRSRLLSQQHCAATITCRTMA